MSAVDQYPLEPGMWIRTEEDERLLFLRFSTSGHWGFFSETRHHKAREYKLPLAGLTPWHQEHRS